MTQKSKTVLLRGGLDLVSPPVAMPEGRLIAALNYEPEVRGYRRMDGYERFDGQPAPHLGSDASDIATRRAAIAKVPGSGPIRGVWVYKGALWAFRDTVGGSGAMYKSTTAGWVQQSFGDEITFSAGTAAFVEGEVLVGGTSGDTATIKRVVLRSGTWAGGDASGYLVVSDADGTFQTETGTSDSGSATIGSAASIAPAAGGRYDFVNHNFFGAAKPQRMYFCNGVGVAFEWDGEVLAPIRTGNAQGSLDTIEYVLARNDDFIITRTDDNVIVRGEHDKPEHIGQYRNHLFLSFDVGAIIHSGTGEPLDYRSAAGAAEIAFASKITGFLEAAATSFVVFGQSRVEYITGNDSTDFVMSPISDNAGAVEWTAQMSGEQPLYLDEAGVRKLGTTDAFGDWRMGTVTQMVEPYVRSKLEDGVTAIAAVNARKKDQYRLFYDDGNGLTMYLGRKNVETIPFQLPINVTCACAGEFDAAEGERIFVGADDGFVYELDAGTSFDGAAVQAYLRFSFNDADAPNYDIRFAKVTFEIDAPSTISVGIRYHIGYQMAGTVGGDLETISVSAGSPDLLPIDDYDDVDWSQPYQGIVESWTPGIGRNISYLFLTEHTTEEPHIVTSMTTNYSYRRMHR